jgi:hypothetical protein
MDIIVVKELSNYDFKKSTKCQYECEGHYSKKKQMDWHHPCSEYQFVGLFLCEAHHSLLSLGRKKRLPFEMSINKTLDEMHKELKVLELSIVLSVGLNQSDIDKH